MNSSPYTIAVVIPNWNGSQYLPDMLDSIIAQTFQDWRCYIVDDQSTDNSLEILKEYHGKDERICYSVRDRLPKGAQTCRNIGLELSVGAEYLIWFDSDDLIAPYCFEQRVAFMEAHQDLDFGVFPAKSFSNDIWELDGSSLFGFKYFSESDLCRFLRRKLPFVGWTNIYRRSSLVKNEMIWDDQLLSLQDSDFNIQSILKGLKYGYDNGGRIDYFWRVKPSSGSISTKIFSKGHQTSHIYFLNKLHETIPVKVQKKYSLDLDDYLFFFIDKFFTEKEFVSQVLDQKWLNGRYMFKARIRLYCYLGKWSKKFLFPLLNTYRRGYNQKISKANKVELQKSILISKS